ncbi:unnamed protein product [Sphenostylis stenocarpa]|uniref:Uncharacterized protein n=1 Tax=Sphenostylis stenocarpa TaxID=92480 RepID=A0AA86T244_9FABA|nr:unnamed protein product [Sphenostylis stenocarpa]
MSESKLGFHADGVREGGFRYVKTKLALHSQTQKNVGLAPRQGGTKTDRDSREEHKSMTCVVCYAEIDQMENGEEEER